MKSIMKRLREEGRVTSAKANEVVEREVEEDPSKLDDVQVIYTLGIPDEDHECRECREKKAPGEFRYYSARVDKNGRLMRVNSLCNDCAEEADKSRKVIFKRDKKSIPKKPASGDTCPECQRQWSGNWHRHHDDKTQRFVGWICGNCNMAKQDQRNKGVQT